MQERKIPEELRKMLVEFGPEELVLADDQSGGEEGGDSESVSSPLKKGTVPLADADMSPASQSSERGSPLFQQPVSEPVSRPPEASRDAGVEPEASRDTAGVESADAESAGDEVSRPPEAGRHTAAEAVPEWQREKQSIIRRGLKPHELGPDIEIPPHLKHIPEKNPPLVSYWGDRVDTRPVQWLWREKIPMGRLVLLAGDPGVGKSFVALELAARVSTGTGWPDRPDRSRMPQNVIVFQSEDNLNDTVAPRLFHAGAALDRVCCVEGVCLPPPFRGDNFKRRFCIPEDLGSLRAMINELWPVGLVIFDPVLAYCGNGDASGVSKIHAMLTPLAELAMELQVTILCTIHLRSAGGTAIYRMARNAAFTTTSRAAWAVVRDPADRERRLLLPVKTNLSRGRNGLAFRIGGEGKVIWEPAPVNADADRLLGERAGGRKLHQAIRWLRELLSSGAHPIEEVRRLAALEDISAATLRRARVALGVLTDRTQKEGRRSTSWRLDETRN